MPVLLTQAGQPGLERDEADEGDRKDEAAGGVAGRQTKVKGRGDGRPDCGCTSWQLGSPHLEMSVGVDGQA